MHYGWVNLAGHAVKENGRVLKVEMTTELRGLPLGKNRTWWASRAVSLHI